MALSFERKIFLCFLLVAVSLIYYFIFMARAQVDLVIESERNTWFQIYWAGKGEPFSEMNSAGVRILRKESEYRFRITDLGRVERLRIDTHQYDGKVILRSLKISQLGFQPIVLESQDDFMALQRGEQVRKRWLDSDGLHVVSSGDDPNFVYVPDIVRESAYYWEDILRITTIWLIVACCYYILSPLAVRLLFVPLLLAAVFALVLVMASVSRNNVHPDEYVHVAAVDYYKTNWLPPEILSEEIRCSYSPYGVSRLNSDEIYYLFAGKFAWLTEGVMNVKYRNARSFNVLLLFCILLYTVVNIPARFLALPFLMSPQVWYVFSYCNSDAFALAAVFAAGCQIADEDSTLNRFLYSRYGEISRYRGGLAGLLLGILLVIKHNYLIFILFAFLLYSLFSLSRVESGQRRGFWVRLGVVCCMGVVLFGAKKAADVYVNGFERGELLRVAQVLCSDAQHDENGSSANQEFTIHLDEKDVSFREMIAVYLWPQKTFMSAFGVYGYFKYSATNMYYKVVRWSLVPLLLYVTAVVMIRGPSDIRGVFVICLIFSVLLTFASMYHSWAGDFQPQGRYLFPIIGMFAVVLGLIRHNLSERWMSLCVAWLFMLSAYSFIFIGLQDIPRF